MNRNHRLSGVQILALCTGVMGLTLTPGLPGLAEADIQPTSVLEIAQTPGTIAQVASGDERFESLVKAATAAGLADDLGAAGPMTVFAPTDEAFSELPAGVLEGLLKPENKDLLTEILAYHIVPGRVLSRDLKTGAVDSISDHGIAIKVEPNRVTVNNGSVVQADIPASNGVIHAVSRVLVPEHLKDEVAALQTPIRGLW